MSLASLYRTIMVYSVIKKKGIKMIGNIHKFAITKALDYAAKLKFVMATHYLCNKFLVFHSPGILFVISLNAWPVYISNGLDTDLPFCFTFSKTCLLWGKMSRIFSIPGKVSTAMIKLKQLCSRLQLRLSKFDRSAVVNLKPISNYFGAYTTCFLL